MPLSSNNVEPEREWLLLVVGAVSSVGVALTGFVLLEILHIETRLALVEWKIESKSHALLAAPETKYASLGFQFPLLSQAKEKPHAGSTSLSLPLVAAASSPQETMGVEVSLDQRSLGGTIASPLDSRFRFSIPGRCNARSNYFEFPNATFHSRQNIHGGLNAFGPFPDR